MKLTYCLQAITITAFLLCSCAKQTESSQFREFSLKGSDGTMRSGAIYLPQGIRPKDKLPVIYMCDGLVFRECGFKKMIDSLIEEKQISPVVIACSYENKMTIPGYRIAFRNAEYIESLAEKDQKLANLFKNHYNYFIKEFIPYIEKEAPVSKLPKDRVFFGTSNSADFGITLSMRDQGLMSEYWCYSPVFSDVSGYGLIESPTSYRICWGIKEEVGLEEYFPNLLKDIRKRGGDVKSWVYNGGHDRNWWKHWFREELKRRFPYKD